MIRLFVSILFFQSILGISVDAQNTFNKSYDRYNASDVAINIEYLDNGGYIISGVNLDSLRRDYNCYLIIGSLGNQINTISKPKEGINGQLKYPLIKMGKLLLIRIRKRLW